MPVYMIKPVKREGIGGNIGHAEDLVSDYLIDLYPDSKPEDEDGPWAAVMRQFRKAKRGEGKPDRLVYWRQEVAIIGNGGVPDDEFGNVSCSEMHYGPWPPSDA